MCDLNLCRVKSGQCRNGNGNGNTRRSGEDKENKSGTAMNVDYDADTDANGNSDFGVANQGSPRKRTFGMMEQGAFGYGGDQPAMKRARMDDGGARRNHNGNGGRFMNGGGNHGNQSGVFRFNRF